jgi:hypothetical protein
MGVVMSVALQVALLLSIVFFSIHLFPGFKLIPTSRRISMHIRTYVCPTSWFCDLSTLPYHDAEGKQQRGWKRGLAGARGPTVESDRFFTLSLSIIFNIIMLAYSLLTQVTADREIHPHTQKEERSERKRGGCRKGSGQDRLRVRQAK